MMNVKVMYHSSTGNTKKVAHAIADSLGIQAETLPDAPVSFSEPVDLLFIGDGVYMGKADKKTIAWIKGLSPETVKNAAVFATCGGMEKIGESLKSLIQNQGIQVVGDPFICKGKAWFLLNRNHPDQNDLKQAQAFALEIAEKINA